LIRTYNREIYRFSDFLLELGRGLRIPLVVWIIFGRLETVSIRVASCHFDSNARPSKFDEYAEICEFEKSSLCTALDGDR
jgi:hypothetical protein